MRAIIAPLQEEIKDLVSYLDIDNQVYLPSGHIWEGHFRGETIYVVRAGYGPSSVQKTLNHFLSLYHPDFVLCSGFAGAAVPSAHTGDIILATEVLDQTGQVMGHSHAGVLEQLTNVCEQGNLRFQRGKLISVEAPITDPHSKAAIGAQHQALAIDMESSVLARILHQHDIPFVLTRTIYDDMDTVLPAFDPLLEDGTISIGRVLSNLITNPRLIKNLPSLNFMASKAKRKQTQLMQAWLGLQLTPTHS